MNNMVKFGSAALAAIALFAAQAAAHGGLGQCYLRADTGYSWPANDDASADQYFVHGPVTQTTLDGTWFVEAGLGCSWLRQTAVGSIKDEAVVVTSSGLRGEVAVGYRGRRHFHGLPPNPALPEDPVFTGVSTVTLMSNLYYDFANIRNITPYVGAGIGAAFHDVDQVTFRDANVTILPAHRQTEFAWQLMAGVSADVGSGILLDLGYRYVDLGSVNSSVPSIGHSLNLDDLAAHEVRVGLRVPLGSR
jgi:opacity protein-like surface antigen